jgi:hypothetical protein
LVLGDLRLLSELLTHKMSGTFDSVEQQLSTKEAAEALF